MADIPSNIPNVPMGAVPPMKKSTGKVQPKKETVRINLPPKPSAAPTIKLPTLPPGGPTGAPSGVPVPSSSAGQSHAAPVAAAPRATAAAPMAQSRPAPAVQRPVVVAAPTIGALDQMLAIAAAITGLIAVGTTIWMLMILKDAVNQ
jgi:hypothetical protein